MEYFLPINPETCLYKFTAQFGSTKIDGIVKDKEEAAKEYEQAVKQGKQVAEGEIDANTKDMLTMKIGNVSPGEQVSIEIEFLQELSISCNSFYQLYLTGIISPRYMKYLTKQKMVNGIRKKVSKRKEQFSWSFTVNLKTTKNITFAKSHCHDLQLISQNEQKTQMEFIMEKESTPNKDFIFDFST